MEPDSFRVWNITVLFICWITFFFYFDYTGSLLWHMSFSCCGARAYLPCGMWDPENLDSVLKSRDITLLTKVHLVKAIVLIVMYGCESWTIKKAECQRSDAFKLWCWRRLLTVPWTARRPNQSILKEIKSEYSLEGLLLKLELQYFGHLTQRADSLENTLMLGKVEG